MDDETYVRERFSAAGFPADTSEIHKGVAALAMVRALSSALAAAAIDADEPERP
jgi:hypothetical protein